jgi:CHAT domain-containing protein/Tfp pilus assembly protein PilF
MRRIVHSALIILLVSVSSTIPVSVHATNGADASTPEMHTAQGLQLFQRGAFEQAVLSWTEALRQYERIGKRKEQGEVLVRLAQAYQSMGHYTEAFQSLKTASALAEQAQDPARLAVVLESVGNLYLAAGQIDEADKSLRKALSFARDLKNDPLSATILNNLGNLLTYQKKYSDALAAYRESVAIATASNQHGLAARALVNAATASSQDGKHKEAFNWLDQAVEQMQTVESSHDKAYGLITIALAYQRLRASFPESDRALLLKAAELFSDAAAVAERLGDPRASSYALGYLGSLYEGERRFEEALDLTRRAVFAGQQAVSPEALYRWHWQTGRLLKMLGKHVDAIPAYRRAVYALQSIRPERSPAFAVAQTSFRESVGALFFELADLLLQQAASLSERQDYEPYLIEARETVELFKAAELRDYFRDECVDAARSRSTSIEIVAQSAAIIYPIILPDRLELLVSLPGGAKRVLHRIPVEITAGELNREVRAFRDKLEKRTTREYLPRAQQLYNWLIRPLEPTLASTKIDTLVFVPDGSLRTIPMAALHDGKQFLIAKYALATTPGLTLTDPRALTRGTIKALSVGLTEPVQGFPPLPNVREELEAIQQIYAGTTLINEEFLISRLEKELREGQFSIVHIASHGQFGNDVKKTFVLTFDDKLTMDRLDQFVGLLRFRDEPLGLLTLSACETAAGDDRAALGLAGVAIKAGARSALATLWFINDQASSGLVSEFYRQFQDPSVSKAEALRRAQLSLIENPVYRHPAYWAAFLLLNNWL